MPKAGRVRVKALRVYQDACRAYRAPKPPATLVDLVNTLLGSLSQRESVVLKACFRDGKTNVAAGSLVGIGREGVRQLIGRVLRRLRGPYGETCRSLLAEYGDPGVVYNTDAMTIAPWEAAIVASVGFEGPWKAVDSLVWCGHRSDLEHLKTKISASSSVRDVDSYNPEAVRLVAAWMGWGVEGDRLVPPAVKKTLGQFMEERLLEVGRVDIATAATWVAEFEGTPVPEGGYADPYHTNLRRAAGFLFRGKDSWHVAEGEYIHTNELPVTVGALEAMVDWCVERIKGHTGPYGVPVLLQELGEAGFYINNLTWHTLKHAMRDRPGVKVLRKANVACAESFKEEGVHLEDRILGVLRDSARPMSLDEVCLCLPKKTAYSRLSVRQYLYKSKRIAKAGHLTYVYSYDKS